MKRNKEAYYAHFPGNINSDRKNPQLPTHKNFTTLVAVHLINKKARFDLSSLVKNVKLCHSSRLLCYYFLIGAIYGIGRRADAR